MSESYLPPGLPIPVPEANGLSKPFWDGLRNETIMVQRNPRTGVYQFPPQWICHDTQTFDVEWVATEPKGVIYSWTRVWHPVHPAMKTACPYIVVVVELPPLKGSAGRLRRSLSCARTSIDGTPSAFVSGTFFFTRRITRFFIRSASSATGGRGYSPGRTNVFRPGSRMNREKDWKLGSQRADRAENPLQRFRIIDVRWPMQGEDTVGAAARPILTHAEALENCRFRGQLAVPL